MTENIEASNLNEVRDQLTGRLLRYARNSDRSITFYLTNGKAITLRGVRIQEHGSYIRLLDRYNNRLILSSSAARIKAKWTHSLVWSLIGLFISVSLAVTANFGFDWLKTTKPTIKDQIEELGRIQDSLTDLQDYVTSQQRTLRDLSTSLHELKREKSTLETILDTDRDKVEALMAYAGKRKPIERWIEWGIAFLIGVFSSLIATLMWHYFSNIRKIAQQEDAGA